MKVIFNMFNFVITLFLILNESIENCSSSEETSPMVLTENGLVFGAVKKSDHGNPFYAFTGIPYAKPPINELRFKAPEPSEDWTSPLNATNDIPSCPQIDIFNGFKLHGVEDCLYLNVYTPMVPFEGLSQVQRPVMVWIHGGGYLSGSASSSVYGPEMIINYDVVIVAINYRLGALGFLSTGDELCPGNNGLKDQVMALKWVQNNILYFGGDPNRVTIFGESAGSGSTHILQMSPMAKGLFHRVISQSGTSFCFWCNMNNIPKSTNELGELLECPTDNSNDLIDCLRTKPASLITSSLLNLTKWDIYPFVTFGPVVEPQGPNAFLTKKPKEIVDSGEFSRVPLMIGVNQDEGAFMAAEILSRQSIVDSMNNNLKESLPYVLDYKTRAKDPDTLTEQIMDFYFQNRTVSDNTSSELSKLIGDRYFYHCTYQAIKSQVKYIPIYFYHMLYKSRDTFVKLFTTRPHNFGAAHFDDIQYLFNSSIYPLEKNQKEKELSFAMLAFWTNFAKTGSPTPLVHDPTYLQWYPVLNEYHINYLALTPRPYMSEGNQELEERLQFWDNIDEDLA